jgi:hypothetical protein
VALRSKRCIDSQQIERRTLTGLTLALYDGVLVRVIRQPLGTIDGVPLGRYRPGQTYDLAPSLADYLVLQGCALIEMRRESRSKRLRQTDRRTTDKVDATRFSPAMKKVPES